MTITNVEMVLGRPPTPGHCTDSRLKHTPNLSEKEDYLHVQELWPEKQASRPFGSLQDAYGGAVWEWRPVDASTSFQFTGVFQKRAYTLAWHPDFQGCCLGTPTDGLALEASRAYTCSPIVV